MKKNIRLRRVRSNRKNKGLYAVIFSITVLFIFVLTLIVRSLIQDKQQEQESRQAAEEMLPELGIQEQFLTVNEYSRPGVSLKNVRGIVVHYTANPGTDAVANRNYFNNLPVLNAKKQNKTYASSHFVIGTKGEIIQCIPLDEIAYASNDRNKDTISIECCHKKKNGKFNSKTYDSLVSLTTYLCKRYQLKATDVIRHYDVTGKNCPKYYVEHKDAWAKFLLDVSARIE